MSSWQFSDDSSLFYKKLSHEKLNNGAVAAFDLDGTIIVTKSRRVVAKDEYDWLWLPRVKKSLKLLKSQGYYIVIFSNQLPMKNQEDKREQFKKKIKAIEEDLGFPVSVFAATKRDKWRKPSRSMYDFYIGSSKPSDVFYCGDAAGRYGDHSCSDRKFAANCDNIQFHTPESFFDKNQSLEPFDWGFHPKQFLVNMLPNKPVIPDIPKEFSVVLVMGIQGSGKTTFVQEHFSDHMSFNNDAYGNNKKKCIEEFKNAYNKTDTLIVIDNTFPDKKSRDEFLRHVKRSDVLIIHMQTPVEVAQHMNIVRSLRSDRDRVPTIAYRQYQKKFQHPSLDECKVIVTVPFVPKFSSREEGLQFLQFSS